jgi:hypothetical protein
MGHLGFGSSGIEAPRQQIPHGFAVLSMFDVDPVNVPWWCQPDAFAAAPPTTDGKEGRPAPKPMPPSADR